MEKKNTEFCTENFDGCFIAGFWRRRRAEDWGVCERPEIWGIIEVISGNSLPECEKILRAIGTPIPHGTR